MTRLSAFLRSPTLSALVARAVSMTGSLALSLAFLRTLVPRDAGLALFVYTTLAVASTVAIFGTNTFAMRESARRAEDHATSVRHAIALSVLLSPLVGAGLAVAVLVQGRWTTPVAIAVVAGLTVLPSAVSTVAGSTLRGLGRVGAGTLAEVGLGVWVAAVGMAGVALVADPTPLAAVVVLLVGNTVSMVWSVTLLTRLLPGVRRPAPGLRTFVRRRVQTLTAYFTASLGSYLFVWLPVLVLGYVVTDPARAQDGVAAFNAAARPAQFVSVVALVQASYLGPRFARLFHAGDLPGLRREAGRSILWATAWALPFAAVAVSRPGLLLDLFGGFAGAADSLRVLVLGGLIAVVVGPAAQVLLVTGLERFARRYTLVLLAVGVVGLSLLAPHGVLAVAWGSAALTVAYPLVCWWRLSRSGIDAGPVVLRRSSRLSG